MSYHHDATLCKPATRPDPDQEAKSKSFAAISRRRFLSGVAKSGALTASTLGVSGLTGCTTPSADSGTGLTFKEIPHSLDNHHHVADNYTAQTLLRWGDSLTDDEDFDPSSLTAEQQSKRFGYNNDFIGFMPLADNKEAGESNSQQHYQSGNSRHGLLCINHEYTLPHLMFPGYTDKRDGYLATKPEHIEIELQANGHSVVEIKLEGDQWRQVKDSPYTRRITMETEMAISGPAAGDTRLQTSQDSSGRKVYGTVGNCAGGKTPWGTVLIAEEGFGSAFMGDLDNLGEDYQREQRSHADVSVGSSKARPYGKVLDRFDVNKEPNEANRFGWMVEYNPYDPNSTPKKRTSLGRFEHEGTTIVAKPGQPIVAYTGDDDEFQFLYKFVSKNAYQPEHYESNLNLLDEGTLYCARLNEDGTGQWIALEHGKGFLTEQHGFRNQADVLIECRRAAEMMGGTPMDRPEDVETNPVNDCTYVMLTKNKKRKSPSPGNHRSKNTAGHILELVHPGRDGERDHTSDSFAWNTFILGGHPRSGQANNRGFYGTGPNGETVSEDGWFATPDNLAFDPRGNIWIATDGCEAFNFHDGLWAAPTSGPYRALPKHFFGCPLGAELCGPEFTPDGTTLFVSVQHPGDTDDATYDNPRHRWPDFDDTLPPRPSVMAIRHNQGKTVGS